MCVCVCEFIYIFIYVCMWVYPCGSLYVRAFACVYAYLHRVFMCARVHMCVFTYVCSHLCVSDVCVGVFFMFVYVRVNEFVCVRAFFSFVRCVCMDACMCVFCAQARGRVCFFVLCEYLYSCVFVCLWLFVPACVRPCVYILKFPCEGV